MNLKTKSFLIASSLLLCGCNFANANVPSEEQKEKKVDITYHQVVASENNANELTQNQFFDYAKERFHQNKHYSNAKVTISCEGGFPQDEKQNYRLEDETVSFITTVLDNDQTETISQVGLFGNYAFLNATNVGPSTIVGLPSFRWFREFNITTYLIVCDQNVSDNGISFKEHTLSYNYGVTDGVSYVASFDEDFYVANFEANVNGTKYHYSFDYFNEEDTANSGKDVSYELFITNIFARLNRPTSFNTIKLKATFDILGYYTNNTTSEGISEQIFHEEIAKGACIEATYQALKPIADRPIENMMMSNSVTGDGNKTNTIYDSYPIDIDYRSLFSIFTCSIDFSEYCLFYFSRYIAYNYLYIESNFYLNRNDLKFVYNLDDLSLTLTVTDYYKLKASFNNIGMLKSIERDKGMLSPSISYSNLLITAEYSKK